jgi:hypothetical protein
MDCFALGLRLTLPIHHSPDARLPNALPKIRHALDTLSSTARDSIQCTTPSACDLNLTTRPWLLLRLVEPMHFVALRQDFEHKRDQTTKVSIPDKILQDERIPELEGGREGMKTNCNEPRVTFSPTKQAL